jgi:hypothetical protein
MHQFFKIAVAEQIATAPADAQQDHFGLIVTPLERGRIVTHEQTWRE